MSKILLYIFIPLFSLTAKSQVAIRGSIIDDKTKLPVEGATITLMPSNISAVTDASGRFIFKGKHDTSTSIIVNNIGYASHTFTTGELLKNNRLSITQQQIQLQNIIIVANAGDVYKPISRTDIEMRGVNNSQEVLRIIPGIVISQHQGGGKAEQIFLRGFDADHGTDFAAFFDGIPVNMPSHAHGQGYCDMHFMIPETVDALNVYKGTYTTRFGDFATSGAGEFTTKNYIDNMVKMEYGQYC